MNFGELVTSEAELRAVAAAPSDGAPALRKQIDHLDPRCRGVIARSPFFVLEAVEARLDESYEKTLY